MADYEIRYLRRDGSAVLFYRPNCVGDRDARRQAIAHTDENFASAEIWKGLEKIETIALQHAA